jgi:para-aminobenzoate synthetase component 1
MAIRTVAWRDPAEVCAAFAHEPWTLALVSDGSGRGRWSYLLRQPQETLLTGPEEPAPFARLKAMLGPTRPADPDGPPFQGGVAGLAGFDLGRPAAAPRHPHWPDLAAARYEQLLAFDHRRRVVQAIGADPDAVADWLAVPAPARLGGPLMDAAETPDGARYEAAVADVVRRIAAGEIFQANVARSWTGQLAAGAQPVELLRRLAGASPAPFAGYLRLPGRALVSNSPERFVQVSPQGRRRLAETRPIKGTAPRGRTADEDCRLMKMLAASAKDRAENLMIVDLMRNDLSRVCRPGAVRTPELFAVETFANVHHLVSTVTGELAEGCCAIDLLEAAFPPGSITGAPKLQAMSVIDNHEPPRGPFFGSLFRAGFDGGFDSSVLIRTAGFVEDARGWRFEARAGAGIVADSDPAAERLETEAKIAAVLGALGAAA